MDTIKRGKETKEMADEVIDDEREKNEEKYETQERKRSRTKRNRQNKRNGGDIRTDYMKR